jgi:hypothetical protein
MATCSVPSCTILAVTCGLCQGHYKRLKNKGDVFADLPLRRRDRSLTFEERFWARVDQSGGPDACWPWLGYIRNTGYGQVSGWHYYPDRSYTVIQTHRAAYILTYGSVPDSLMLDHTCHTKACDLASDCPHRACCNPRHLEPVTPTINTHRSRASLHVRRAQAARAQQLRALTHCKRGHPLTEGNIRYTQKGTRDCLTCKKIRYREERQRLKSAQYSFDLQEAASS